MIFDDLNPLAADDSLTLAIKLRREDKGAHAHIAVFVGADSDHLQNSGEVVMGLQQAALFEALLRLGARSPCFAGRVAISATRDDEIEARATDPHGDECTCDECAALRARYAEADRLLDAMPLDQAALIVSQPDSLAALDLFLKAGQLPARDPHPRAFEMIKHVLSLERRKRQHVR